MACGPAALALRLLTRRAASLALAGCLFITAGAAAGADWPQWRGARRDGIAQERGMQTSWAGGSPPVAWSRALGEGFSGISIVGDRAYTLVGRGDDELVICIDANTGDDAWDLRIDRKFTEGHGHGPRDANGA